MNEKGLLNWNVVGSVVLQEEKDTPDYFIKSATALAPIFNTIYKHFTDLDTDGFLRFMAIYGKYIGWTSSPQLALSLANKLNEYTTDNGDEILEWFLLYFPLMEQSPGDLYLCKGQQCPSVLKDLLVTEELRTLLNLNMVKLLRILIGPPI